MRILFVIGTRPEAIKILPLVKLLRSTKEYEILLCSSGQHRELLEDVFEYFKIFPDISFDAMREGQTLNELTVKLLNYFDMLICKEKPDMLFVHGDTATAFCAALTGFYNRVKVAHVEAGLRTYDKNSPYPEEFNRTAIDAVSDILFAPTHFSAQRLLKEGRKQVFTVGNTVIDALRYTLDSEYASSLLRETEKRRILLVTAHRRENIGKKMEESFLAVRDILEQNGDMVGIFPVHPNPAVKELAYSVFKDIKNIKICDPMGIYDFHNILARSFAVITDSGGIQEEAAYLGVPVFLMRDTTEREEGRRSGNIKLLGTSRIGITQGFTNTLKDKDVFSLMREKSEVFGDGRACERIAEIISSRDF